MSSFFCGGLVNRVKIVTFKKGLKQSKIYFCSFCSETFYYQLFDSHAHIYLPEFNSDRDLLIENALSSSIERILMPAIDSSTHEAMFKTEEQFPGLLQSSVCIPAVNEGFNNEIEVVKIWLLQRKFIGIGEYRIVFYLV